MGNARSPSPVPAIDVRRERASPAGCRSHPLPQAGEGRVGAQRRVPRDNFPSPKIIATGSLPLLALAEQQRCSPKADRGPLRWGIVVVNIDVESQRVLT